MNHKPIIIGTRGSDLALWQARETARLMPQESVLEIIKTTGDRFLDIPLQGQVDKGFFTKEIEAQLLEGKIDLAVHSLKDLPTQNPPGLEISAYLPRAPYSDILVIHPDWHDPDELVPIRDGCKTGATSLRRQALLKSYAPHAVGSFLRGNVPNRIQKCKDGQYGAIIIARAGAQRLNLDMGPLLVYEFNPEMWLPAPGQGAIAIQVRQEDKRIQTAVAAIDHRATREAVSIERNLLATYEGGCHTAFGSLAQTEGEQWMVNLGMESDEGIWRVAKFTGSYDSCAGKQPDEIQNWEDLKISLGKQLCKQIDFNN